MESSNRKILLHIGGMTCVNCQNKIEKELKSMDGVVSACVSYNNGTAEIVYDEEKVSVQDITSAIEKLNYDVIDSMGKQTPDITRVVCILVIIIALYFLLQSTGVLNLLVPSRLADTQMGYGMLFVIGLITSVHCIAMCGGINLSQCIPGNTGTDENVGKMKVVRPSLLYNLGRVISYTAIGFVLGLIGMLLGGNTEIGIGVFFQGVLKIIAGVFMVIMGINMLGLFPGLRKLTIRMPRFFSKRINAEKTKNKRPFYIGVLNGLMPCGPLQSMWIVALVACNPFAGAMAMFLFCLGTVPLMLGLGSLVSALGRKFTDKVMIVGAVLVVVLGLAMLSQGGALSGWIPSDLLMNLVIALSVAGILFSIPIEKKTAQNLLRIAAIFFVVGSVVFWNYHRGMFIVGKADSDVSVEIVNGVQIVHCTLESGSYPNITVQAGMPVQWIIDAPEGSINGCNYKIVINDLDIEYTFQTGENIIEFTPEDTATIRYSCWMGMIHGNIFVTD